MTVAAWVKKAADGSCEDVRVALTNMASTPIRASATESLLRGSGLEEGAITRASEVAADDTDPPGDLNATPDYKRHLAGILLGRAAEGALTEAIAHA